MENQRLIELIAKKLTQEISQEETSELSEFLKTADNLLLYEDLKSKWDTSGNLRLKNIPKTENSWIDFKSKIEESMVKEFKLYPILYKVAAVLVVAVGLGYFYFQQTVQNKIEFLTEVGQITQITLPDSTKIWLNESSYLAYDESYNTTDRQVLLKGEAFFKVQRIPEKPFIVTSNQSRTKVLGTSFNISAYDNNSYVNIDVNSGKVSFSELKSPTNQVILEKGESAKLNLVTLSLNKWKNQNPNYSSWRTKTLTFEDADIKSVINDMSKYFGITIHMESENIGVCKLTSTFSEPTIEEILEVLHITLEIEYTKKNDEYFLSGKGC